MISLPPTLIQYAALHRDQRNILVHIVSIPVILVAIFAFSSPLLWSGTIGLPLALGWITVLVMLVYFYVKTAGRLGWISSIFMMFLFTVAQVLTQWLGGIGALFLLFGGYLGHRLGHWYEGNYALLQFRFTLLSAAPLFVSSQILQRIGGFQQIYNAIEAKAGPSYIRDMLNIQPE